MALKRATYTRPSGQEPGLDEKEGTAVAAKPRARARAERPSVQILVPAHPGSGSAGCRVQWLEEHRMSRCVRCILGGP
ncbi:unnamed protein product [Brassica rapa subsp. trilocularis]